MVDVMNEIANAMNVSVDYVEEATFATMIDTLNSGRVDIVVSGIWPSSARALKAGFSRAVYYSAIYAYVRADDDRFDGDLGQIDDPSFRIAAIDGELSSIVAGSDYPKAVVVGLPQQADVSQLLLQLTTNKADVTFVEPAIAEAFLTKNPGSIRRVANVPAVRLFPNTFLFRRGDAQLREAINLAIVELANAGGVARIIKQYDPIGKLFTIPSLPVSP
jgi:polar amino acid transport system substrate-binding protein